VQWRFFESSRELNDAFSRAYFNNNASNRWLAMRLELIGNMAVGSAALFAVLQAHPNPPHLPSPILTYVLAYVLAYGDVCWLCGDVCWLF
jgi:hypothetical protein